MKINRILLTPTQIMGIPAKERALLVLMGHGLNEINTLDKLLVLSGNFPDEIRVKVQAQTCQGWVLARVLIGKLAATWEALQKGLLKNGLKKQYSDALDEETLSDLEKLGKYFGRENFILNVRKKISFHYDVAQASAEFPDGDAGDELAMYFHDENCNSLYLFAEFAMNNAMTELVSPRGQLTAQEALNNAVTEVRLVTNLINSVIHGVMFAIVDSHLGGKSLGATAEEIDIGDVPPARDVVIPFFVEGLRSPAKP